MSDKITKTVIFEIEPSGDCDICNCMTEVTGVMYCKAFDDVMFYWKTRGNLSACKDYLSQEKAKVYCDDCKHFIYDWTESECTKGNENTCGETFARNNWYCNNCTDREE